MKTKLLFLLLLTCVTYSQGWSQFLNDYYKSSEVSFKNKDGDLFMEAEPAANGGQPIIYQWYSNIANGYANQNFKIENGVTANYYRLRHLPTGKYVTVIASPGDAELRNLGDCPNTDYQEFKFIQQTNIYLYKIHAHFSHGGIDEVIAVNDNSGAGGGLKLQQNKTAGDFSHQVWYITNLRPPVRPSDAIASLEDQYEGKTVGLEEQQRFFDVRGVPDGSSATAIYANTNYTGFESQFKLEYTDEVGWFTIKHKPSNKYITIIDAYDGGRIGLAVNTQPDRQKFKFIFKSAGKYEIHSKYTQGPEIGNNAALLLQMHPTDANVNMYLGIDNTAGAASDGWQLFNLTKYVNPATAAEFSSGAAVDGAVKLFGKQYHITARETLAMLAPYIVGSDTFVRVQQSPVYGEASEWVFDPGQKTDGKQLIRIRYGKTGQYLYLPVATDNTEPNPNTRLRLKTDPGRGVDKRFEFGFYGTGLVQNWFQIQSNVGSNATSNRILTISDDGYLNTDFTGNISIYNQDLHFCINLAMPTAGKMVAIFTKNQGHYLSDSGIKNTLVPLVHQQYIDYSCFWTFIQTGSNYYIQNQLTKQYLSSNNSINAGEQMYVVPIEGPASTKWTVERNGNFYNIKNLFSGKYLGLYSHLEDGGGVYQGSIVGPGVDFIITRTDYNAQPELPPLASADLLTNFSPAATNPFNTDLEREKLMKNIGLPFEPIVHVTINSFDLAKSDLAEEGFNPNGPYPTFYNVLRSALTYKFAYTATQVDNAFKNYKFTIPGHRMQMTYALRSYILQNLSLRNRSTWTFDEVQLVEWLERKMNKFKKEYGDRLEDSWEAFKLQDNNFSNGELSFGFLYGVDVPDYQSFETPDYYPVSSSAQSESIMDYVRVNKAANYKNPGDLSSLPIPYLTVPGGTMFNAVRFPDVYFNNSNNSSATALEVINSISEVTNSVLSTVAAVTVELIDAGIGLSTSCLSVVGSAAGPVAIILTAGVSLVTTSIEVAAFTNYDNDMNRRIDRLQNSAVNTNSIMQGKNLLNQYFLCEDLDYIFATGQRFDGYISDVYTFTGNGNWNLASNWENGLMPPANVPANSIIYIKPATGSCILNVPVTIPATSRLVVSPGKLFKLSATLTVPGLKIVK